MPKDYQGMTFKSKGKDFDFFGEAFSRPLGTESVSPSALQSVWKQVLRL
jgi:hypothetical protein